jgi:rod shape-determining protein MreD
MALMINSRYEAEVRRYPVLVLVLVPLIALILQAYLPLKLPQSTMVDLPLLVAIYFSLGRRSPVFGTLLGAFLGMMQDSLTHLPIGINGVAKTIICYLASSIGIRIDVEHPLARVVFCFFLSLLSSTLYIFTMRQVLQLPLSWVWYAELLKAVLNSGVAFVLFALLDRMQIRD